MFTASAQSFFSVGRGIYLLYTLRSYTNLARLPPGAVSSRTVDGWTSLLQNDSEYRMKRVSALSILSWNSSESRLEWFLREKKLFIKEWEIRLF